MEEGNELLGLWRVNLYGCITAAIVIGVQERVKVE